MILTLPLLTSYSQEKAHTANQQLNVRELQASKKTNLSLKDENASFTQNSVVYAKSIKLVRLESQIAKEKARIIARNPLGIQVAKKAVASVVLAKDTVVSKPREIVIQKDTIIATTPVLKPAVKPAFNVTQLESYMRKSSDLKKFNVVVGSFSNPEEAFTMVASMVKAGFSPVVVPNEKGMFRVIASSQTTRDSADVDALRLELDSVKCWIWTQVKK